MNIQSNFVELQNAKRIWAIGSMHSCYDSFESIKNYISDNSLPGDKIVFLGNIIGFGNFSKAELLTKKLIISKKDLDEKLSYLMEKGFVNKNEKNGDISYYLDTEKLSKVLENDDNFKNIDDGLAKLDSFLN